MTTPTPLAARLDEITVRDAQVRSDGGIGLSICQIDRRFLLRILSRLGDEKVVEAALRAWQRLGDGTRSPTRMSAALSAALTEAMEE